MPAPCSVSGPFSRLASGLILLATLSSLLTEALTQTETDIFDTNTLIEKTLHPRETLRFDVEPLFPKLAKDLRINYENDTLQAKQPLLITKPLEFVHSAVLTQTKDCSRMEPLNYSHVQLVCDSNKEYRVVFNDFGLRITEEIGVYRVPAEEFIYMSYDVADDKGRPFVYILSALKVFDELNNTMVLRLLKILPVANSTKLQFKELAELRFGYPFDLLNTTRLQEVENYWVRTTRCPLDAFQGLTSCEDGSPGFLMLFPHYRVRPGNPKTQNFPEALVVAIKELELSEAFELKVEGLFVLDRPGFEYPYPSRTVPRGKIVFEFDPQNDWFMSMMPSPTGVWFLYNSLGGETSAFSIGNCTFEVAQNRQPNDAGYEMVCRGDIASDFAPLCRNSDLELMNFGTNYWVGISNDNDGGAVNVNLLTNCLISKLSYNKSTGEPLGPPKIFKLPYLVQGFSTVDKSANQLLGFVKSAIGSNRSYLLTFPDKKETVRIYQNVNLTHKIYAFSLDSSQIDDEIIMCYDFDNETNSSSMNYYAMTDEMIITDSAVMDEISPTTFTAQVIGESASGQQIVIDFRIRVIKNFSYVDAASAFGEYWYYDTDMTVNDDMRVILPIDNHRLHGNDLKITSAIPSRVNLTRDQYRMSVSTDSVWHIKVRNPDGTIEYSKDATLKDADTIVGVATYQNYMFVAQKKDGVSVYKCGVGLHPDAMDTFICTEIVLNIPRPDVQEFQGKNPADAVATKYRNGTICISLIWLGKEAVHVQTINVYLKRQPEFISHSFDMPLRMVGGNLLYNRKGLMFLGVGHIKDDPSSIYAVTCNLELAKRREYFSIDWLVSKVSLQRLQIYGFEAFDDDNFAIILQDTQYYLVFYVDVDEVTLEPNVREPILVTKVKYEYIGATANRILVQRNDTVLGTCNYGFLSDLERGIGSYIGELPLPCGANYSLQKFSDNHGIATFIILDTTESENPLAGNLLAYAFDFRFVAEDPLDRLIFVRKLITPVTELNNSQARAAYFIDFKTFDLQMVAFLDQFTSLLTVNLYGAPTYMNFKVRDQSEKLTKVPLKVVSNLANSQSPRTVNMVIRSTEFDWKLVATPQQDRVDLNDTGATPVTKSLEQCVAYTGHLKSISLWKQGKQMLRNEDAFVDLAGVFTPLRVQYYATYQEAVNQTASPGSADLGRTFLDQDDSIKVALGQSMIVTGKNNFTVWRFYNEKVLHKILDEQDLPSTVMHTFINHETRVFNMIGDKGPIVFVTALLQGDYEFSDLWVYVVDTKNSTNTRREIVKNFCRCDKVRFEVLNRVESIEEFTLGFFYRQFSDNGTSWTSSLIYITPKDRSNKDSLLAGFEVSRQTNAYVKTFKLKPIEASEYGILKPTQSTVLAYYFFEHSGQLGLFYREAESTSFSFHQFSKDCFPVTSKHVSCKIFEADVEIHCMVLCDLTRIINFKVRIHVDDIEIGAGHTLAGVELIASETVYKIPVNYQVKRLCKGDHVDLVVIQSKGEDSVLTYSQETGYIINAVTEDEFCSSVVADDLRPKCSLMRSYFYSLPSNRWMMLGSYVPFQNAMFVKQSPQITFRPKVLREKDGIDSVKDYTIKLVGLVDVVEIPIMSVVNIGEYRSAFVWIFLGTAFFLSVIATCALVVYQNWRADEELKRKMTISPALAQDLLHAINASAQMDKNSRQSIQSDLQSAALARSRKNARLQMESVLEKPT